nr:hypothetical protein Iba_chr05eCG15210 [Ipomoea batatas]
MWICSLASIWMEIATQGRSRAIPVWVKISPKFWSSLSKMKFPSMITKVIPHYSSTFAIHNCQRVNSQLCKSPKL